MTVYIDPTSSSTLFPEIAAKVSQSRNTNGIFVHDTRLTMEMQKTVNINTATYMEPSSRNTCLKGSKAWTTSCIPMVLQHNADAS